MTFSTRNALPAEADFLFRIYANTRTDEIVRMAWMGASHDSFLCEQVTQQWKEHEFISEDGFETSNPLDASFERE